jgi:hypothetical protein
MRAEKKESKTLVLEWARDCSAIKY